MEDDMRQVGETGKSHLWPKAARERSRRRSLDQVIKLAEERRLTPDEKKKAAKLRRLLNDLDLPEADEHVEAPGDKPPARL
jgi:hypothetical protein